MTKRLPVLLVCDDDQSFQLAIRSLLKDHFQVRSANNGDEALVIVKNHLIDVLLLDVQMRTPDEGLKFIPKLKEVDPDLSIIMSSGVRELETITEALRLGAMDYVAKEADVEDVKYGLLRVLEKRNLLRREEQQNFEVKNTQAAKELIGSSKATKTLREMIEKIRRSPANVVIHGETGAGKEIVARQLRNQNDRGVYEPFVAIDSATIQSTMAESLLFGHEKGAFTGAIEQKKGAFEEANGGVIYFDEISNMPLEIQAKLLRVIQEKELSRLGSSRVIPLQFRVIAATNKKLEDLVAQGKFMEDLYQRLNVLPIHVPALRERIEDLPDLLVHFAKNSTTDGRVLNFTEDTIECLKSYRWPGNVREVQNLVSYLSAVSDVDDIEIVDLPPKFKEIDPQTIATRSASKTFYDRVAEFEKAILQEEFKKHEGNISRMAAQLGMDRSHLYTKLKLYDIFTRSSRPALRTVGS